MLVIVIPGIVVIEKSGVLLFESPGVGVLNTGVGVFEGPGDRGFLDELRLILIFYSALAT